MKWNTPEVCVQLEKIKPKLDRIKTQIEEIERLLPLAQTGIDAISKCVYMSKINPEDRAYIAWINDEIEKRKLV